MEQELKKRIDENVKGLDGYYTYQAHGRTYSVVDFSTTMKSHPMPAGIFMGWEAVPVDENEGFDMGIQFRSDSWESLKKLINETKT